MPEIYQPIDASLQKVVELDALIRELKPQLENSLRFNRINSLVQNINFSLLQISDHTQLFNEICKIAVESGIFKRSWIGLFDEETEAMKPVASCRIVDEFLSIDKAPMLEAMRLEGPIFSTIRNGEVFILNDIVGDPLMVSFHETAKSQNYRSMAAFPLYRKSKVIGGIFFYSSEVNFFTDDVVLLFKKVADTISIRLEDRYKREDVQEEIEELRKLIKQYDHIIEKHYIGMAVIQDGLIKFANETFKAIGGYPIEESINRSEYLYLDIIHPNDRETVESLLRRKPPELSDSIFHASYFLLTKDQREIRVQHFSKEITFEGMPAQLVTLIQADKIEEIVPIEEEKEPITEVPTPPLDFEQMYGAHPFTHLLCSFENLKIQAVNDAALRQFGYSPDEFLTLSMKNIFSEIEHQRLDEIVQKLEDEFSIIDEWTQIKKDGTMITTICSIWQTVHKGEKYLIFSVVDTSKQTADIQEVKKWRDAYKLVFHSIGDAVLILDRDLLIIESNKAAELLYGSYAEELIGQSINILIEEKERERIKEYITRAFAGEWIKVNLHINRIDGKILPVNGIFSSGTFFGKEVVFVSLRDIEELRPTEEEYSLYQRVLQEMPLPTAIADSNREIMWGNHAFSELTGYSSEELKNQYMILSKAGRDEESLPKELIDSIYSGNTWSGEIRLLMKDGKTIETEHFVTPIKDETGAISHFIIIVRDISSVKKKQRREIQDLKWETSRTMLKTLSHDFNNLLSIVLGYASFIERYTAHPNQVLKGTDEIKRAVQRGANLLREIVVSVEEGDGIQDAIDVNDVVEEIVDSFQVQLPKDISITTELGSNIPDMVLGREHVRHIVTELLKNARAAISDPAALNEGIGHITIKTRIVPSIEVQQLIPEARFDEYLELTVTDNGVGIDEKTQIRIFDPFFRTKDVGKGVGLTRVYSIVKFYNGYIDVESEPGYGTTFTIILPVSKSTVEMRKNRLDEIPGGKETILVVEDEKLLLDVLHKTLEEKGYKVLTAHDGIEGIKIFNNYRDEISLIISDMGLPKLSGFEMYEQIRKIKSDVKAIVASGYVEPEERTKLLQAGIKKIIRKPYQLEEILLNVREVLNAGNSQR